MIINSFAKYFSQIEFSCSRHQCTIVQPREIGFNSFAGLEIERTDFYFLH